MSSDTIEFRRCLPYVWVRDVKGAIAHYRDVLGFSFDFEETWTDQKTGLLAGIAEMRRGAVVLRISTCECPDRVHVGRAHFRVDVDPVRRLHDEFRATGATIARSLRDLDWGVRCFTVEDPEGNRIEFEGPIPPGETVQE